MTSLTRLSLANRIIVGLATLAIIVFGVLATRSLKQELLPSIQVPTAIVTANYPGVSPQIIADDVITLERIGDFLRRLAVDARGLIVLERR